MPSPVGHALAGLIVHTLTADGPAARRSLPRAALMVGAALAPDVDLLFRFVDGQNHHQAETHGIGCALLAGLLVGLWARSRGDPGAQRTGVAVALSWFSHTVLDYFGRDTHPPIGLMALWPLSRDYFKFPWPIFLDIGRRLDASTTIANVRAALREILILLPLLGAAWMFRSRERG